VRRDYDFYPTPAWATRELLKRVRICGVVLEPCVGDHDIATALTDQDGITNVLTNDLSNRYLKKQPDMSIHEVTRKQSFDVIVYLPFTGQVLTINIWAGSEESAKRKVIGNLGGEGAVRILAWKKMASQRNSEDCSHV
jgi:hypothetical protein